MNRGVFIGAVVLAMSAAPAFAQTAHSSSKTQKPAGAKAGTQANKAGSDEHFVMEAAKGGLAEVELGRLATEKASSPQVKQFGQRMVDDHGKAADELKTWATQKNVTLPTELDAKHKATVDGLGKLSGASFDRAYMKEMVSDHDKDVAAFERAAKASTDADLKAWAASTLPTLKEHQKMAHDISGKLTTTTTKKK
jgi:putative membrane protein